VDSDPGPVERYLAKPGRGVIHEDYEPAELLGDDPLRCAQSLSVPEFGAEPGLEIKEIPGQAPAIGDGVDEANRRALHG